MVSVHRAFQPRLHKILCDMEDLSTFSRGRYDEPIFSEQLEREFPNYRVSLAIFRMK